MDIADDDVIVPIKPSGLRCEHYALDTDIIWEAWINDRCEHRPHHSVLITCIMAWLLWRSIWTAHCCSSLEYWISWCRWRKITESVWSVFFVDHLNSDTKLKCIVLLYSRVHHLHWLYGNWGPCMLCKQWHGRRPLAEWVGEQVGVYDNARLLDCVVWWCLFKPLFLPTLHASPPTPDLHGRWWWGGRLVGGIGNFKGHCNGQVSDVVSAWLGLASISFWSRSDRWWYYAITSD